LVIQGAIDGVFEPLQRVRAVADPLLVHQLKEGRPQSLDHAAKQEQLRAAIKALRAKAPGMTFAKAWERLQKSNPDLFEP